MLNAALWPVHASSTMDLNRRKILESNEHPNDRGRHAAVRLHRGLRQRLDRDAQYGQPGLPVVGVRLQLRPQLPHHPAPHRCPHGAVRGPLPCVDAPAPRPRDLPPGDGQGGLLHSAHPRHTPPGKRGPELRLAVPLLDQHPGRRRRQTMDGLSRPLARELGAGPSLRLRRRRQAHDLEGCDLHPRQPPAQGRRGVELCQALPDVGGVASAERLAGRLPAVGRLLRPPRAVGQSARVRAEVRQTAGLRREDRPTLLRRPQRRADVRGG